MEHVVLVDKNDNELGTMNKMDAHKEGVLHRAFSVFLFNDQNELLLHKRATLKYHSSSLWTNTCCSHPRLGESSLEAAIRRTKEEMGINCIPNFLFKFIYKANLDNGLIEHELDHVFVGQYDGTPTINPEEVEDWKYISLEELKNDMGLRPHRYSHWFKLIMNHEEMNRHIDNIEFTKS